MRQCSRGGPGREAQEQPEGEGRKARALRFQDRAEGLPGPDGSCGWGARGGGALLIHRHANLMGPSPCGRTRLLSLMDNTALTGEMFYFKLSRAVSGGLAVNRAALVLKEMVAK